MSEPLEQALKRLQIPRPATPEETARRDAENKARDARFSEQLFNKACVPDRLQLRELNQHPQWHEKFAKLLEMVNAGATVGIVGGRGPGKSRMGAEAIRQVTGKLKPCLFTSLMTFFMDIKSTFAKDATNDEREIVQGYTFPHLLVIDEVGKRAETEWQNALFFELLNRRYNAVKPTILIDNRTKAEFIEYIGPSIASRITEGGGIIECNWESFRPQN